AALRIDLDVVRAVAVVDGLSLRQAHRQAAVPDAGARQPPSPRLARLARIAHVNGEVELIVLRVLGIEVGGAAREVGELAVHEPEPVDAAGLRPRSVEEGEAQILQRPRVFHAGRVADVEEPHPGRLLIGPLCPVGYGPHTAGAPARVAAGDYG